MHLGTATGEVQNQRKKGHGTHAPGSTAPGAMEDKESKQMRSMHLGLLHLGQCKPHYSQTNHEKHAPGATAPGAIQTTERTEIRSMHLGLLHLGELKLRAEHCEACNTWGYCIWCNRRQRNKSNEKHAPGATAPGPIQVKERRELEWAARTWDTALGAI
jgi:hypothetical protein